jgi:hypothetical protein
MTPMISASVSDVLATGQLARTHASSGWHAGIMAQPCGSGASLEAPLPAQRHLVFEQEAEPFGMFEAAGLCGLFEFIEGLGHAVKAKVVQHVEGWMGQHQIISFQWK